MLHEIRVMNRTSIIIGDSRRIEEMKDVHHVVISLTDNINLNYHQVILWRYMIL